MQAMELGHFQHFQLCTDPCDMGLHIVTLKHEVMEADEWQDNVPQDCVMVSLCIQIAIDKMLLCSLSVAYACPYHNPTTGHSVDIRDPHWLLPRYLLSHACPPHKVHLCNDAIESAS
jgi:hypothetical protein